jgi:hypothetical protein
MLYQHAQKLRPPKRSKPDVDFRLGNRDAHCGRLSGMDENFCKHFIAHRAERPDMPGICALVNGSIERNRWCKLHEKAFAPPVNLPRRVRTKEVRP